MSAFSDIFELDKSASSLLPNRGDPVLGTSDGMEERVRHVHALRDIVEGSYIRVSRLKRRGRVTPPNHFYQEVTGDRFQVQASYYKEQTGSGFLEDPDPPAINFVF